MSKEKMKNRSLEIYNYIAGNTNVRTGELVRRFGHEFNQQMNYRNRVWKREGAAHIECKRSTVWPNQFDYYAVPASA